jgi:UDP-N-acetylglucosamine--N-acetylmuramyl-(pentapeptide) pyrophosphoryl-undecaprenol N-acetylglucosamine transferase
MTALLVTATGGHLSELVRLRPRVVGDQPVTWVTFRSGQSEQLLRGEDVVYAEYMPPRGYRGLAVNALLARRLFRERTFDMVISNGAGVALSFLPLARAHGIETHYIECAARTQSPSLSGRVLARVPGVHLYAQYPSWARGRWTYGGSVLEQFSAEEAPRHERPRRIVVLLGTMPFPFTRLVAQLQRVVPKGVEIVWQSGSTPLNGAGPRGRAEMTPEALRDELHDADVVVSQGGVGSTLDALDAGRLPVLVPRRKAHREHVDDHQAEMSYALAKLGLAITREADDLAWEDLLAAAAMRVRAASSVPPFRLR